ncbi:dihydrofolate reductase [Klenkia terrae]|uniref:dihydrofolate reductase n=1 Tax=Klenkia terrae TaxID=1052259 RepID=UPI003609C30C
MSGGLSLVVAVADDGVIGDADALPWHISEDLRRFRELTTGHVLVAGRRTHESITARLGQPLPGRHTVVVSGSTPPAARRRSPPVRPPPSPTWAPPWPPPRSCRPAPRSPGSSSSGVRGSTPRRCRRWAPCTSPGCT